MEISKKIENLSFVYNQIQEQIKYADTKASLLIAIAGIIISSSFSLFPKGNESDNNLIYLSISIISSFITTIILIYSIYPNLKSNKTSLIFFNDINLCELNDYSKKIEILDDYSYLSDLTTQIYYISNIVAKKMYYMKLGVVSIFVSFMFYLIYWYNTYGIHIFDC